MTSYAEPAISAISHNYQVAVEPGYQATRAYICTPAGDPTTIDMGSEDERNSWPFYAQSVVIDNSGGSAAVKLSIDYGGSSSYDIVVAAGAQVSRPIPSAKRFVATLSGATGGDTIVHVMNYPIPVFG